MLLQRVESRSVGDRTYYKYVLTIPEEIVRSAGWAAGGSITARVEGTMVILSLHKSETDLGRLITRLSEYEAFRDRIRTALSGSKEGLSWAELRKKLALPQKVPNNVWVHRLELDIGLLRVKRPGGVVWRLP